MSPEQNGPGFARSIPGEGLRFRWLFRRAGGCLQLLSSVGASGPFFLIEAMAFWAEALEL
jgi:hypothetical protein